MFKTINMTKSSWLDDINYNFSWVYNNPKDLVVLSPLPNHLRYSYCLGVNSSKVVVSTPTGWDSIKSKLDNVPLLDPSDTLPTVIIALQGLVADMISKKMMLSS